MLPRRIGNFAVLHPSSTSLSLSPASAREARPAETAGFHASRARCRV